MYIIREVGKAKNGKRMYEIEKRYTRQNGTNGRRWIAVGDYEFIVRIFQYLNKAKKEELKTMEDKEALEYLKRYQAWRKGEIELTMKEIDLHPVGISVAIDKAIKIMELMLNFNDNKVRHTETNKKNKGNVKC